MNITLVPETYTKEHGEIYTMEISAFLQYMQSNGMKADMIITDPPYAREYRDIYYVLGKELPKVLKEGGFVFVYGGLSDVQGQLNGLLSGDLRYNWVIANLHRGSAPKLWYYKIFSAYKPIYMLTNGDPYKAKWVSSVQKGNQPKKVNHRWEQDISIPKKLISMFSEDGDTILDPMCGTGTFLLAAKKLGRKYIGNDKDLDMIQIVERRLGIKSV